MKKISKKSLIKGLKYSLNLALILLFILLILGVFMTVDLFKENHSLDDNTINFNGATIASGINNIMISLQSPNLGENLESIKHKFHILFLLCGFVNVIALILVTLQLKLIFTSFSREDYFNPTNSIRIQKIATIIFLWVIADFVIRFIPDISVLHNYISSSIGLNSFRYGILSGIAGINIKMLIVSIIVYMLSIIFSYGNDLKEESSLTI